MHWQIGKGTLILFKIAGTTPTKAEGKLLDRRDTSHIQSF